MKKTILSIFIIFILTLSLYSLQEEISYNVATNFKDFLYKATNVELIKLNNTPNCYRIKQQQFSDMSDLDLYLSFDTKRGYDDTDRYKIVYNNYKLSGNKSIYKNGGYFVNEEERLELVGENENYFFQTGTNLGSFSISFWFYPISFSDGEVIIRIGSQYYDKQDDKVYDESIVAKVEDGRIIWEFNNVFKFNDITKDYFKLGSYDRISPETWNHMSFAYDAETGIMRQFLNGKESGVGVATLDGTLDSSIYRIFFQKNNRCVITLAPNFNGGLDEFYVFKKNIIIEPDRFPWDSYGEILTNVIRLGETGGRVLNIKRMERNNYNSDIIYYYRYSPNNPFTENDDGSLKWNVWDEKTDISNKYIKYIQLKILFLPGRDPNYSPEFSGLKFLIEKHLPPSKPIGLKLFAGDKSIKMKWIKNSERTVKGYKIYYGTKSNYYFGESMERNSPIDIGLVNEYELKGLRNNIIYYVSVTAYDGNGNESPLSYEEFVRPLESSARR